MNKRDEFILKWLIQYLNPTISSIIFYYTCHCEVESTVAIFSQTPGFFAEPTLSRTARFFPRNEFGVRMTLSEGFGMTPLYRWIRAIGYLTMTGIEEIDEQCKKLGAMITKLIQT